MNLCNCTCKSACIAYALIAGLVIGIIAAFLQITAVIAITPTFLWVLFGVAVVYLGLFAEASANKRRENRCPCLCSILRILLLGILGTILFSATLLLVDLPAAGILSAILTGLLLFAFTVTVAGTGCFIRCLIGCDE